MMTLADPECVLHNEPHVKQRSTRDAHRYGPHARRNRMPVSSFSPSFGRGTHRAADDPIGKLVLSLVKVNSASYTV